MGEVTFIVGVFVCVPNRTLPLSLPISLLLSLACIIFFDRKDALCTYSNNFK